MNDEELIRRDCYVKILRSWLKNSVYEHRLKTLAQFYMMQDDINSFIKSKDPGTFINENYNKAILENAKCLSVAQRENCVEELMRDELMTFQKNGDLPDILKGAEKPLPTKTPVKTSRSRTRLDIFYLCIFAISIGITILLFWKGFVRRPDVAINFNVGEIIAGILGGSGVAAAGGAYAYKTIREIFS